MVMPVVVITTMIPVGVAGNRDAQARRATPMAPKGADYILLLAVQGRHEKRRGQVRAIPFSEATRQL